MKRINIHPGETMSLLSQQEVALVKQSATSALYQLFRNCALAVLNSGSHSDNVEAMKQRFSSFQINVLQSDRGVMLELINPPEEAFVDGKIIRGIQEHLFAVLRDILFVAIKYPQAHEQDRNSEEITNAIFDIIRNAGAIQANTAPNLVTCWGGHSISSQEYNYTKEVGYQFGLRGLNICTGCGPGAMKGPMKGATIGHAKQRLSNNYYVGLTEPGIIAAEPPNPIVNQLVILPDIEKRLEAFVRTTSAIVIFPGGAGTAEELLYLLGILLNPKNHDRQLPLILTGPASAAAYFDVLDEFIGTTLGPKAQQKYQIILDDPAAVATHIKSSIDTLRAQRKTMGESFCFNWSLHIEPAFQQPFNPNHDNMAALDLNTEQAAETLAANLRKAFSGIVAGNIKPDGIKAISQKGPFQITGDAKLMLALDHLLKQFVSQGRMKLPGSKYAPCYEIRDQT
jgi:hypothetical protein